MAALRYAARRLGDCAVLRLRAIYTVPAVKEVAQRRLLRTVAPTSSRQAASSGAVTAKPPPGNTTEIPRAKPQLDEEQTERFVRTHLAKIQRKKEELYSLIAELDSALPGRATRVNVQLALELCTQIQPKPGDLRWYWYRGAKMMNSCMLYGGCISLACMALSNGSQTSDVEKR